MSRSVRILKKKPSLRDSCQNCLLTLGTKLVVAEMLLTVLKLLNVDLVTGLKNLPIDIQNPYKSININQDFLKMDRNDCYLNYS